MKYCTCNRINPYPWIFATITELVFWKKSRIVAGDVTLAYANMKGDMPCLTKICAIFWDRHRARFPEKIQSTETYTNDATLRSGFLFSAKRARWRSRVLDFFQDSRIRVKSYWLVVNMFYSIEQNSYIHVKLYIWYSTKLITSANKRLHSRKTNVICRN